MKVISLLLVGLTPILLALPTPKPTLLQLDDIPMRKIVEYAGKDGRANLAQTCSTFRDIVYEKPECEALPQMFSAFFECPKNSPLHSRLVDHLRKCTARENDLPVEYAPGVVASTGKKDPSMPVYPLYVAIKNNANDVAEALLERGNIQMNLTIDPILYSGNWGPNAGVGFLYFNPVWAAIDNQQFDLALRIIKSPHISIYGYFRNQTRNPVPISNPSFFIPHVISFYCNSEQAQKNDNAIQFCMKLINEFPRNSFKLASCNGLPDHPSWSWSILQKSLLDSESIQHDPLVLAWDFPYAGKHSKPKSRYESNSCGTDCECAVEVGIDYAIKQKDLSPENEKLVISWIKSLNDSPHYLELRRTMLRSLMENKRYPQALHILQEQPQRRESLISSYSAPKGFHKKWFENRSYDEVLLLDAFFYGNDQIIQHFLNNSRYITPDFLKKLVDIGETCGKSQMLCLFGSGLQVPEDNLLVVQSFINRSLG